MPTDPALSYETRSAILSLARHFDAMGGWRTASTFYPGTPEHAALDEMLQLGHVKPGKRGHVDVYELTPAGYAWLATQGS